MSSEDIYEKFLEFCDKIKSYDVSNEKIKSLFQPQFIEMKDYRLGASERNLLHLAAFRGRADLISFFLEKGADINSKDGYGKTALILAGERNKDRCVEILLNHNADLDITDERGRKCEDLCNEKIKNIIITKRNSLVLRSPDTTSDNFNVILFIILMLTVLMISFIYQVNYSVCLFIFLLALGIIYLFSKYL